MADYRQIHVKIWTDEWFLDLEPEEKLLFVYLFSNRSTSVSGIYEFNTKVAAFETGLDRKFIDQTLAKFQDQGKVFLEGRFIWVINLRKYNANPSDNVFKRISADLKEMPDGELKDKYMAYHHIGPYRQQDDSPQEAPTQPPDSPSIPPTEPPLEQEQEQEHEQEHINTTTSSNAPEIPTGALGLLLDVFTTETGLSPTGEDIQKWDYHLSRMHNQGVNKDDLRMAIKELQNNKRKRYTITGPWSVEVAAINVTKRRQVQAQPAQDQPVYAEEW